MSSIKRISYPKEPILKVHRYICKVMRHDRKGKLHTKFHYCINLNEVDAVKKNLKSGHVMDVHRASHNFITAYYKE